MSSTAEVHNSSSGKANPAANQDDAIPDAQRNGTLLQRQSYPGQTNPAFSADDPNPDAQRNNVTLRRGPNYDPSRRQSLTRSISSRGGAKNFGDRLAQYTAQKYRQKLNVKQLSVMANFSSVNFLPTHSNRYSQWLSQFSTHLNWDRWVLLLLIGISIGLLAGLMKQCLQLFNKLRWTSAKEFAEEDDVLMAWMWNSCIGVAYIIVSSFLVVFIHQPAVGSGVPEVISYLNGITVHGVFTFKNFVVKFISLIFAVSSGLPAATQGPIIALGAIIGAGIGQFKSESLGFTPKWFSRFRNAEDRRTFTTAGVAAGVAAAFNAPIGGLLFAMEDLSSFWDKKTSWQTFFCCGIAAVTANIINTALNAFESRGNPFGLFSLSVTDPIQIHVLIFIPAVVLGVLGGFMGAFFTRFNSWMVRTRKKLLAKFSNPKCAGLMRMLETILLVLIMSSTTTLLPLGFDCTVDERFPNDTRELEECGFVQVFEREPYNCNLNITDDLIQYSEVATLMQGSGTTFLEKLTSRGTHYWFSYVQLLSILPIWYFMTMWTLGSAIAGGIFVPNMITGALYGRCLGMGMCELYAYLNPEYQFDKPIGDPAWEWMDPGIIAAIGAASLLGGVTRLNLAITVIIVEMCHDLDLTVPVLIAIWVAKITADIFSKPLYKYQLDGKSLPYLDEDPTVVIEGEVANLELYEARDVMNSPVLSIKVTESLHILGRILMDTSHSGFPIVKYDEQTRHEHAIGLITRTELYVLLCSDDVYNEDKVGTVIYPEVDYEQISVDYLPNQTAAKERVRTYTKFPVYHNIFLNMEKYINRSVVKVDQFFSLYRSYMIFRKLGLRHMLVADKNNRVVGMITRKDLLPFAIERKITHLLKDLDGTSIRSDPSDLANGKFDLGLVALNMTHDSIIEVNEDEAHGHENNNNNVSYSPNNAPSTKF